MGRLRIAFPYLVLGLIAVVVAISNIPKAVPVEVQAAATCPPCGMEVERDLALTAALDGDVYYFCSPSCRDDFAARSAPAARGGPTADESSRRLVDVVCNMEVNAAWGIRSDYEGKAYYFCAQRCKQRFEAGAQHFLSKRCIVCETPLGDRPPVPATYLGKAYQLCSVEHRVLFKADPANYFMHTMWGIPTWLYYTSIAIVLVVSFGVFDWLGRRSGAKAQVRGNGGRAGCHTCGSSGRSQRRRDAVHSVGAPAASVSTWASAGQVAVEAIPGSVVAGPSALSDGRVSVRPRADRFDLLTVRWINTAVRSRVFRFVMQAAFVVAFVLIMAAGLWGNQNPAQNVAPILTWTIWWGLLPVLILFAGKAWCYVCPWDAIAGWTEKLSFWKKQEEGLSLAWRWPRVVRNISIATILFVGLTWIELGFGVTMKPRMTAYLGMAMLLMAVLSAILFDRKSFCRYGCLVGRVSGLYALFAGIEIRPRSRATCTRCGTKECVTGSQRAYGCPTFLYPGKLQTNTYCIQCMECIQACPHDNLAMNLRPLGEDLAVENQPRSDEAYLALLMLAITAFHGLTMTPVWQEFVTALREAADVGRVVGFSLAMTLLMVAPIGVYATLVAISRWLGGTDAADRLGNGIDRPKRLTYRDYFIRYAYALLPIALFYHVAHNAEHLLMEGPKIAALISDPLGLGWDLFGTAARTIPPMISLDKLWLVQVLLVLIGHVYSLWVAQRTSLRLFGSSRRALKSQLPMLAGMICFSLVSLWLLKQPMEMRTSAM